jgi:protein-S-isoprenylcysteine O-methyltransferase Ste14
LSTLELRVPPDVVALVAAGLMWLVARLTPGLVLPLVVRLPAATALFATGIGLVVVARVAFARASTTFSPRTPGSARVLVTAGVYRLSRNPMYLGTTLILIGVAVLMSSPVSLVLCAGFVFYIDRLQIAPEERILAARFSGEFERYARDVRRWV